jgi:hypothetical protein
VTAADTTYVHFVELNGSYSHECGQAGLDGGELGPERRIISGPAKPRWISLLPASRCSGILDVLAVSAAEVGIAERVALLTTRADERAAWMLRRFACTECADVLKGICSG